MKTQAPKTDQSTGQGESRISAMLSNSTRLELVVVAAVLLVLMLYSKPPRSGNAEVTTGNAEMPAPAIADAVQAAMRASAEAAGLDEMPPVDVQPRTKRVGIVDARNCGNPKYKDLMYGEVTVRWVWNGGKFVPQKVCVVDEGNGVTSVWSFDQQNGVTVTERQEPVDTL